MRTNGQAVREPRTSAVAAASDTSAIERRRAGGRAPFIPAESGLALTEADFCRLIEAIRRERERPRNDETCPDGCRPAIVWT